MMATQETAEHYWNRYCYTKDLDWLRASAYPFIKGAADLYQSYDGLRKEADGKYHFYNTNLHEHIWAGKDVIDDLAMARGTFAAAIQASTLLGVDESRRAGWQEILDNLAPYPLRSDPQSLWAASTNSVSGRPSSRRIPRRGHRACDRPTSSGTCTGRRARSSRCSRSTTS